MTIALAKKAKHTTKLKLRLCKSYKSYYLKPQLENIQKNNHAESIYAVILFQSKQGT